jgi:hypothetical protein
MNVIHITCITLYLNTNSARFLRITFLWSKTHFLGSIWTENIFENLGADLNSNGIQIKLIQKKIEKKGEKNKKIEKAVGDQTSPATKVARGPASLSPEPLPSLPLSLACGPHMPAWPPSSFSDRTHHARKCAIPFLQSHWCAAVSCLPPCAIRRPPPPLHFPQMIAQYRHQAACSKLAKPQTLTSFDGDYDEHRQSWAPSLVLFSLSFLCAPYWHVFLLECVLVQAERPWPKVTICWSIANERFRPSSSTSSSATSKPPVALRTHDAYTSPVRSRHRRWAPRLAKTLAPQIRWI